ncbi:MAG: sarcosine oxidase subunit gamma [Ahrensia sp.]|nr:sarcosine oxidase subunit gamma [Ahrensia sp.]
MANIELLATRSHPLSTRVYASKGVAITPMADTFRCSLRCDRKNATVLSKLLGLTLPTAPKKSVTEGTRTAMWLGPDEWLIIDAKNDPNADLAASKAVHSAVDISHRNSAIQISGPAAADVINAGCPQDLSQEAFPVGACSRTIMGKIEIVLLRVKPTVFRLECWRSFSGYAFDFLSTAARDAG